MVELAGAVCTPPCTLRRSLMYVSGHINNASRCAASKRVGLQLGSSREPHASIQGLWFMATCSMRESQMQQAALGVVHRRYKAWLQNGISGAEALVLRANIHRSARCYLQASPCFSDMYTLIRCHAHNNKTCRENGVKLLKQNPLSLAPRLPFV